MSYPRLIIAAPHSGSGKTTITCGILAALKNQGLKLCSFKCGPDYIDPMFHRNVLGIPAGNLDTFFTEDDVTRSLFVNTYQGDIGIIEGVMGLYDGIGGVEVKGSTYDLARVLKAPIVLVVDAKGVGRSILAEIKGFLDYDVQNLIAGVILNRTSAQFGNTIGELIEKELGIKYLGTVPNDNEVELSSRHLGLVVPEEIPELQSKNVKVAKLIAANISLEELKNIANSAEELGIIKEDKDSEDNVNTNQVRLAVARDKAFCFYYRENLTLLQNAGVELVEFSPIKDAHLPEDINGILLGGGYPEYYLKELEANISMKSEVANALKKGVPVLAECGGFMYLLDAIYDKDGNEYEMVGAIKGKATWQGKLTRFGYVTIESDEIRIKGHEFHYYDTDNNGDECIAKKPTSSRQWKCIHRIGNSFIGFPHLYYPSNPDFVKNFVEVMKNYGRH